jgi:hypothetical protein
MPSLCWQLGMALALRVKLVHESGVGSEEQEKRKQGAGIDVRIPK